MAIVTKEKLYSLWKKFSNNPSSLDINEYKTILDTSQTLVRQGEITRSEAEKMISATSKYTV